MAECQKMQERIQVLERNRDTMIKDQVKTVLSACQNEVEAVRLNIERTLRDQGDQTKALMERLRHEHDEQKAGLKSFSAAIERRIERIEPIIPDYQETSHTLYKLKQDFETYVNNEREREVFSRRLEILVKDMESRNWPWRPNMDRSPSPPRETSAPTSVALGGAGGATAPAGVYEVNDWRPWPTNGPVRPTPPSSRPSSARSRRPPPGIENTTYRSASTSGMSSAGSGLAVARVRPSSARGPRSGP